MDVEIHLFFCYTIFIKGRIGVLVGRQSIGMTADGTVSRIALFWAQKRRES